MHYSVSELLSNLEKKILDLKSNPKFLENPAYSNVILEIKSEIMRLVDTEGYNNEKMVTEENGIIYFEWRSPDNTFHRISIECPSPENIVMSHLEEKRPPINEFNQTPKEKNVQEIHATLTPSGGITINNYISHIDSLNCKNNECNESAVAVKKVYSENGVMLNKEEKTYLGKKLSTNITNTSVPSMLHVPRGAFGGLYDETFTTKTTLVRQMADTARLTYEDRSHNKSYSSTIQLNWEHGLRDMRETSGYTIGRPEITIPRISREEINQIINMDNNPKVQEELQKLSENREFYTYNSLEDPNFKNIGFVETQGKSR